MVFGCHKANLVFNYQKVDLVPMPKADLLVWHVKYFYLALNFIKAKARRLSGVRVDLVFNYPKVDLVFNYERVDLVCQNFDLIIRTNIRGSLGQEYEILNEEIKVDNSGKLFKAWQEAWIKWKNLKSIEYCYVKNDKCTGRT